MNMRYFKLLTNRVLIICITHIYDSLRCSRVIISFNYKIKYRYCTLIVRFRDKFIFLKSFQIDVITFFNKTALVNVYIWKHFFGIQFPSDIIKLRVLMSFLRCSGTFWLYILGYSSNVFLFQHYVIILKVDFIFYREYSSEVH